MNKLTKKGLFLFSLPSIFACVLEPLASLIDSALVGHLSTAWLAALALGTTLLSSFSWIFNFLVHVSTESVAKSSEVDKFDLQVERIQVAVIMSVFVGMISTLFLFFFREKLYVLIGVTDDLKGLVEKYYLIRVYGHIFSIVYITLLSILKGQGKVSLSFIILFVTTVSNIFFSWYFLFVMKMSLEGAAYGTVIANIFGVILSLIMLIRSFPSIRSLFKLRVTRSEWKIYSEKSGNLFIRSFLLTAVFFMSTRLAASLGTVTLAAHQVLIQVWLFSSLFVDGVAVTGNILGAKLRSVDENEKIKLLTTNLLKIGFYLGGIFTICYFMMQNYLWNIFSTDMRVHKVLESVWYLIWLSQIPNAIAFVYDGLMFGHGEFKFVRNMMLIGAIFIYMPLASGVFIFKNITSIWVGLITLNIFRWFCSRRKSVRICGG